MNLPERNVRYLSEREHNERYRANTPVKELLLKQSKGKFLTAAEKTKIANYERAQRLKKK